MPSNDWLRVKEAFQSALELDSEELEVFLENFRNSEPLLFRELESLLRHRSETANLPDCALRFHLADDQDASPWIDRQIGSYRVVAKIGEGGMGTVFQAIRIDDHYVKSVAIKVVRAGFTTGPYLRHFRSERQILATLDHPNIAHLLDGGATEEGVPYLVMEYVSGKPIDEYCDSRRLHVVDRLRLFLQVCSAVEYAHQKLVIHRDLKPANILVTADGAPKLLDFGIAKLLDPELYFQTEEPEATMIRPMTPEYACPEQVRGDRITTAADIYSLGIVLYRLLTGRPPYVLPTSAPAQWSRVILQVDPERPSAVVDRPVELVDSGEPAGPQSPEELAHLRGGRMSTLRRNLRGDLDNIVLMALRKDPSRRYASVEQFANDIRRFLEGMPVSARRDTIPYRAGKFVRRHRIPLAAVALVLISLTAGILIAVQQARIANRERALAEQRFNDIRGVSHDLIFEIHDSIQYLAGSTPARKVVVQAALRYLNALSKDAPKSIPLQDEIATAYEKVGDAQGGTGNANLGDTAGALESYRKSLAIRNAIYAAAPSDPAACEGLARSWLRIGNILQDMGHYQEALQYHRQHLDLSRRLALAAPSDLKAQSRLARSADAMGDILVALSQWDEGLKNYEESAAIFQNLSMSQPEQRMYKRNWALERKKIGGVYEARQQIAPALQEYRAALAVDEELAKSNPQDASAQRDLAIDYTNLGDAILKRGDPGAAVRNYRRAIAIDNRLALKDPKNASAAYYDVHDSYRLGDALFRGAHVVEAIHVYQSALVKAEKNALADPQNAVLRSELARVYSKLGKAHFAVARNSSGSGIGAKQKLAAARKYYRKSLAVWIELRDHGALQGTDSGEPDRVAEELKTCDKEIQRSS